LLNTTLRSDEFPFVWNKIALEIHRATLDIHITDLVKSWVRAHHFCFLSYPGLLPVVYQILPKSH